MLNHAYLFALRRSGSAATRKSTSSGSGAQSLVGLKGAVKGVVVIGGAHGEGGAKIGIRGGSGRAGCSTGLGVGIRGCDDSKRERPRPRVPQHKHCLVVASGVVIALALALWRTQRKQQRRQDRRQP